MMTLSLFVTFLSVIAGPYNCDAYGAASYGNCSDTAQTTPAPAPATTSPSPTEDSTGNPSEEEQPPAPHETADEAPQTDSPAHPATPVRPSFFSSIPFVGGALDALRGITQPLARIGYDVIIPGTFGLSVLSSLLLLPLIRRRRKNKDRIK